jgi:septum site-determining protein MinD
MEKIIGIVSGKGGVGKTTFTANVAMALTNFGKDVIAVDADLSTSNLGLQLGFYQFPLGLQDALDGNIGILNAIYTHPSGLKVVPASVSLNYLTKNPTPYRLKSVLSDLSGIILIDSPPGLNEDALLVLKASDDIVIVTNPEIPSVTDALKIIKVAREMGKEPLGIVVNRVRDKFELTTAEIEEMCDLNVIGRIPDDKEIKRSMFEKMPIVSLKPHCRASVEFSRIAAALVGEEYSPPSMLGLRRIFSR